MNPQGTSERAPAPQEVINRAITAALMRVRKCLPVVVTSYDPKGQKVSVKPLIKDAFLDEDDARQVEVLPIINGVPVVFPSSGGHRFTVPISDGNLVIEGQTVKATTGVLFISDRSLDRWLSGTGQEVDPEIDHEHDLTDGIFMPGLNPFGSGAPLANVPNDVASVGSDSDGNGRIDFKRSEVQLGSGATKGVARKDDHAGGGSLVLSAVGTTVVTLVYNPGDGSLAQTAVSSAAPPGNTINLKEKITSASDHIKAVD